MTDKQIKVFNNTEFGEIRSMTIDGEPWFVGKDVAAALGYSNPRKAIGDHVDAVKAGLNSPNVSNDVKTELSKLSDLSNKFHRVDECGMIEPKQE